MEITTKGALPYMTAALLHKNLAIQHQAVWGIANLSTHGNQLFFLCFRCLCLKAILFACCRAMPREV